MDSRSHIVQRGFQAERRDRLRDDFRRKRPDRMHAKYLAVLFFCHHFDEPFVLTKNCRFAIPDEREFAGLDLEAGIARLLLR